MQNISELRKSLLENYEQIKDGSMDLKMGKELANTAGKVLTSVKLELEYNQYIGAKEEIDFLKKN